VATTERGSLRNLAAASPLVWQCSRPAPAQGGTGRRSPASFPPQLGPDCRHQEFEQRPRAPAPPPSSSPSPHSGGPQLPLQELGSLRQAQPRGLADRSQGALELVDL
jgi:hypothetical protein